MIDRSRDIVARFEPTVDMKRLIPKSAQAWWLSSDEKITQNKNILTFKTVEGITYNFNIATDAFVDNDVRTITFLENHV